MPLVGDNPNDTYKAIVDLLGAVRDASGSIQYPNVAPAGTQDPEIYNRNAWDTAAGLPSGFDVRGMWGGKDNQASGALPDWIKQKIAEYNNITDPSQKKAFWRHLVLGEGVSSAFQKAGALNPMPDSIKNAIIAAIGGEPSVQ